jgi:NADH dehydrogenase [ubiquinone] 1 alpha subcomplex assembly factor 6
MFLTTPQFQSLAQLEQCADLSNYHYLLFQCAGVKSLDCDHAASHLGKCQLICAVVKSLLRRSNQSVYYVPADLLRKHKIAQQDLIVASKKNEAALKAKRESLKDLTFEMCTRANQHLNSARELCPKVPREARLVLVQAVGCGSFLKGVEKCDFDLMDSRLSGGGDFRRTFLFKLMLAKFKNTY